MTRFILTLAAIITIAGVAPARDFSAGQVEINQPWARPTPPSAPVAGGYMKLHNLATEADRLIEVTSPIAERAEIHRSIVENGIVSMRPVERLVVEPKSTVDFEMEKLHVMFIKPYRQLKSGENFPVKLVFERAGSVDVEFIVQMRPTKSTTENHSGHGSR